MSELFERPLEMDHREPAPQINAEEFEKVIRSRRSVRVFSKEDIPEWVMQKVFDLTLLAPNSSNLQPWEFYWLKDPKKKREMQIACLDQPAAKTANQLIVCVARTKRWREMKNRMLDFFNKSEQPVHRAVLDYYQKLVPLAYSQGPLGFWGLIKKVIIFVRGLFYPTPRGPSSNSDMQVWATKSCALACENMMLAFRAYGYDSCPMEGMDELRVRKILKLPKDACVVMVIGAGKRASNGVYGPQIRFDRELFIKEV